MNCLFRTCPLVASLLLAVGVSLCAPTATLPAQTVTASIDVESVVATLPEYGMGIHTSVYDNSLRTTGSPDNLLDGRLDDAGVNVLRYPG